MAAIIRSGQLLIPRPDLVLQPADEVLAVVHASQATHLAALLGYPACRERACSAAAHAYGWWHVRALLTLLHIPSTISSVYVW